jgi:hypothetical protein
VPRTASTGEVVVALAPDPRSGQTARRSLDDLADHLSPETMAKLRLLVTELVVAALAPAENRELRLSVRVEDGTIRAEIGPVADGEELAPPVLPRRWSLFLVNRIAERWGNDDGLVWFELEARGS